MSKIPVVGMDPSLNNWGIAHGSFDTQTQAIEIASLELIQPEQIQGKQVRNNSRDLDRARQLSAGATQACRGARAVFIEVPVGSQSARAMASYGICIGVLGALAAQSTVPFEITPNEVKLATVGTKTASKQSIIDRAVSQFPDAGWPYQTRKGQQELIAGKAEHMADAIGAIEAGVQTAQFRQLIQMLSQAA